MGIPKAVVVRRITCSRTTVGLGQRPQSVLRELQAALLRVEVVTHEGDGPNAELVVVVGGTGCRSIDDVGSPDWPYRIVRFGRSRTRVERAPRALVGLHGDFPIP